MKNVYTNTHATLDLMRRQKGGWGYETVNLTLCWRERERDYAPILAELYRHHTMYQTCKIGIKYTLRTYYLLLYIFFCISDWLWDWATYSVTVYVWVCNAKSGKKEESQSRPDQRTGLLLFSYQRAKCSAVYWKRLLFLFSSLFTTTTTTPTFIPNTNKIIIIITLYMPSSSTY